MASSNAVSRKIIGDAINYSQLFQSCAGGSVDGPDVLAQLELVEVGTTFCIRSGISLGKIVPWFCTDVQQEVVLRCSPDRFSSATPGTMPSPRV